MTTPGGDADETVRLRIQLQNEVSRPAAEAKVSIDEVADSAEKAGLRMDEETLAANRLKRAMNELAAANEAEAKTADGTAKQKLAASRSVRSAEKEAQAALKEVDRLRKKRDEDQKKQTQTIDKETAALGRWARGWKGVLGVLTRADKFMVGMFGRLKKWDNIKKVFTGIFNIFKWTAIAGGILYAAHALTALGTAGVAAMGGLVPLMGLYAGIPAIMASMAVGAGVFKAATMGIGSTLQAFASYNWQAAYQGLAKMAPAAAALTLQLNALRISTLRPLQQQLQQIFAGTLIRNNLVGNLRGFIGSLQPALKGISQTLGQVVSNFGSFVNQPMFKSDFQTNLGTANTMIRDLGHAFTVIIGAINHAAAILQPFFTWFSGSIAHAADSINNWVNSAKGEAAITHFFQTTETVAKGAWQVLKNFGSTVFMILHAASPLAAMMGGHLLNASKEMKNYLGGPRGQAQLNNFLKTVQQTLSQLFTIVGPLLSILHTIFVAAQPFINTFGKLLSQFALWLSTFLKSSQGQRMLNTLFKVGGDILKTLVPILETIVQVFADLLPYAKDFIETLLVGIKVFLPILRVVAAFLGGIEPVLKPIVATLAIMFAVAQIQRFLTYLDVLKTKWMGVGTAAEVAGAEQAAASGASRTGMLGGAMGKMGSRMMGAGLIYMGGHALGGAIGGDAGRITSDAATGAAAGFMLGGVPGAVLGGLLGAVKGFTDDSNRLTQAMKDLATAAQNWTDAITHGASKTGYEMKQSIAQLLIKQGMDSRAIKSGIDLRSLVNVVASGNVKQLNALVARWQKHGSPSSDTLNILRSDFLQYASSAAQGRYEREATSRRYLMGHGQLNQQPAPGFIGELKRYGPMFNGNNGSMFGNQPGQTPKASSTGRGAGNSTDWWSRTLNIMGRWSGGLVSGQTPYMVGEHGPEMFRNQFREFMVGLNGPEVRVFNEPGTIVPNHSLAAERQRKVDAASPYRSPTIRSIAATTAPRTATIKRRSGSRDLQPVYEGPLVQVDQIVTRDAATVRRELQALLQQAEATKPEKIHWRKPREEDED